MESKDPADCGTIKTPSQPFTHELDIQMDRQSKLLPLAFLVGFNLLQFSTYVLNLPTLFLVSKGLMMSVAVGGFLRLLRGDKKKFETDLRRDFFSQDSVEKFAKFTFKKVNFLLVQAVSVIFWDDPLKSLYSLLLLYLLGLVLKVVPSVFVTFVLVWVGFIYVYMNDFFKKNVYRHFEPHLNQLVDFLNKLYNTIPRLNEDKLL